MQQLARRTTLVTYLEMFEPVPAGRPWPDGGFTITQLERPSVRFYRYLYDAVGADWLWVERKYEPDAKLAAEIQNPLVEIHMLAEGGVPAGFGELDRRAHDEVKLQYFGLVPEAIGRGLGRWFLEQITARAWRSRPQRVWVHTCDLDHPRALANYEAAGFRIYDRKQQAVMSVAP